MTIQIFANNAKTTLAAPITSTQTTITVAPGTGSEFPNPTTGQQFKVTLNSVSSPTVYEICNCTSRSGDTLTVIRGQEGTTALPFVLNDVVGHFDTAGVMSDLVQTEQLQAGTYSYADVGGTANALTATVGSNLTTIPDGLNLVLGALTANTGAATLTLTLGSTIQSSYPIVKGNNSALVAGDIPARGYPIQINWSPEYSAFVMQNPATGIFVAAVPTGAIVQFPATTAPTGYLIAEGQLVSRTTYAALWTFAQSSGNIISDSAWQAGQYGSFSTGDGSTNFRIPQYGGYFLRSLDNGNGIDPSRAIGTVQSNQNLSHTHSWSGSGTTSVASANIQDPSHYHTYIDANGNQCSLWADQPGSAIGTAYAAHNTTNSYRTQSATTGVYDSGHNHGFSLGGTTSSAGGNESRPINISILTCIKY